MTTLYSLIGMAAGAALWLFGWWRQRKQKMGHVPLIAPVYLQFFGLLIVLIFAADFISAVTGVTWKSPFRPQ